MPDSNKPKAFLVVTIPTHLRVMMDVANLLEVSGRYAPQIIYYPSAVFDQNHQDCINSRHQAFIWRESGKFSKVPRLSNDKNIAEANPSIAPVPAEVKIVIENSRSAPTTQPRGKLESLLGLLPQNGTYVRLRKKLPFLPSPSLLRGAICQTWALLRFCFILSRNTAVHVIRFLAKTYWLLLTSIQLLLDKLHIHAHPHAEKLRGRPFWHRYLLAAFAESWCKPLSQNSMEETGFIRRITNILQDGLFVGLRNQKIFLKGFSELLAKENPALVILPEENLFYYSHLVVHAAHCRNIPCVVTPFTIVNTLEWAEAFYDMDEFRADQGWNRIFARAFPCWVLEHRGRRLILPSVFVMVCEYLGIVPDQPWVISSGPAEAIAAESQFMCDYYLRAGIRPEKIRLTGTVADDKIHTLLQTREEQLKTLAAKYTLDIRGKVILIALPPDQFPGGKRPGCEFDGYQELIRFMVSTVSEASAGENTILINLHPRINRQEVGFLESLGAAIIAEPIEQLVPLADIYVAVVSATIRLAISCGIPTVNYDAYHYHYDDYNNLAGICEVNTREAYANTIASLIHDEAFFSRIQAAQKDTANRLFTIDGKAGARLLALFDELSGLKTSVTRTHPDFATSRTG